MAFIISCFLVGLSLIKYIRGASLLRKVDAIYVILGFVYVVILLAHGWRLDAILIFAQCLLFGMSAVILIDNLLLRKLLLNITEDNVKKDYVIDSLKIDIISLVQTIKDEIINDEDDVAWWKNTTIKIFRSEKLSDLKFEISTLQNRALLAGQARLSEDKKSKIDSPVEKLRLELEKAASERLKPKLSTDDFLELVEVELEKRRLLEDSSPNALDDGPIDP